MPSDSTIIQVLSEILLSARDHTLDDELGRRAIVLETGGRGIKLTDIAQAIISEFDEVEEKREVTKIFQRFFHEFSWTFVLYTMLSHDNMLLDQKIQFAFLLQHGMVTASISNPCAHKIFYRKKNGPGQNFYVRDIPADNPNFEVTELD